VCWALKINLSFELAECDKNISFRELGHCFANQPINVMYLHLDDLVSIIEIKKKTEQQ